MDLMLSTPGMTAAFAVVLVLEAFSLIWLAVNVQLYRTQLQKYRTLLSGFGDEKALGRPGKWILPLYVLLTIVLTLVTTLIFIWQPHLV